MNLKTLALVACCLVMPAMAGAQDPMAKDSMSGMKHEDMDKKMDKMEKKMDKKMDKMEKKMHKKAHRSEHGTEMEHSEMKTSGGPGCARGCPTSSGVAGLTGVQFLALQQELRDRGCGNNHVTGVLDAPTKKAIRTCARRLNVEATAAAVLNAMNIGFTVGAGT